MSCRYVAILNPELNICQMFRVAGNEGRVYFTHVTPVDECGEDLSGEALIQAIMNTKEHINIISGSHSLIKKNCYRSKDGSFDVTPEFFQAARKVVSKAAENMVRENEEMARKVEHLEHINKTAISHIQDSMTKELGVLQEVWA